MRHATLILTFTESVSLATWRDTGMLAREWALYRELLPHYARIILVTHGHSTDPGILAPLLAPADAHKVHVVCNHDNLPPADYTAAAPARVAALIPADSPTIVKTNQMHGGELALAITNHLRSRNHPTALIARGGYPWSLFVESDKGPKSPEAHRTRAREHALCTAADLVVGTTQEMLDHLVARHALDPARTRLIPNYVDLTSDPTPVQQRDAATLLYAGQLVPRKRVHLLIEALSLLPKALRETTRLDVFGEGAERPSLRNLAEALTVNVTLTPRIPHHDLLARMHTCTIYVQASALEGHPKTVIEAMTTGAPVIAAQAPGLEVIAHNTDGLLVAPTPRALAAAIEDLLTHPRLRSRLGTAAAHTARRRYGLPTIVQLELAAHRDALLQPAAA
ncbi:MAG TPA: glycosyltransferase family 4 protein [Phycisphaerales bacterium]|nr:glycosyltransferase family 4 protein [Phycisphaerales bacterium]